MLRKKIIGRRVSDPFEADVYIRDGRQKVCVICNKSFIPLERVNPKTNTFITTVMCSVCSAFSSEIVTKLPNARDCIICGSEFRHSMRTAVCFPCREDSMKPNLCTHCKAVTTSYAWDNLCMQCRSKK